MTSNMRQKSSSRTTSFNNLDSPIEDKEWEEMLRDLSTNPAPSSSGISYSLIKDSLEDSGIFA
ncbi:32414_t:CDS:2 [Gigaspora margarita]|uniref:32414_t:CDS:1 n=1 Tax=Gigaspora margarita TaxID=4874 RepID=A0ABN7V8M9_GIGMA|nr:32414_t:CDS:2 [Gigaspora margarita]